jgi:3-methyladenine DNA glycosylase AlkD
MNMIESEAQHLLEQIEQHADAEHRAKHDVLAPTALKVYGVRVPDLRKIARAWHRAHKEIAQEDLVALVEALWSGESREQRVLATLLLEHYSQWVGALSRAHFERWRQNLDGWELTDGLGWTLALWLAADLEGRQSYLQELIVDEDVWSRRLALVPTARLNRGKMGATAPDLTLSLIDQVKAERHPMITKAVSWVLRETIKTHRDQVADYLEQNRNALASHVVREVDNKLRTGLKQNKR